MIATDAFCLVTGHQVASEPKKDPFFARRSDFLQAIAALWSKKIAKYGGKWDFLGQTAILLTSYDFYSTTVTRSTFVRKRFSSGMAAVLIITSPVFTYSAPFRIAMQSWIVSSVVEKRS